MAIARVLIALVLGAMTLVLTPTCAPSKAPSARVESERRMHIAGVAPDPARRPTMVLLEWQGQCEHPGELFALIDEHGYHGLVRTRGRSSTECSHCPTPRIDAELVEGIGPDSTNAVAVGPVSGKLRGAQLLLTPHPGPPGDEWRAIVRVDLDGDGGPDVQQIERCGSIRKSSCVGETCASSCSAVTRIGERPDPNLVSCAPLVPIEDC